MTDRVSVNPPKRGAAELCGAVTSTIPIADEHLETDSHCAACGSQSPVPARSIAFWDASLSNMPAMAP
jgi:hypothetical protein